RARVRRSATTVGWWPVRWYQTITRLWASSPNGTVRSGAASGLPNVSSQVSGLGRGVCRNRLDCRNYEPAGYTQ
ncbi:MAG: hypothetical protein J2O47_09415, partial [Acidimicrobiaceae bacterium]|nr:hypothetical protein [Acidimicrobiaceae bacterium]